MFSYDEAILHRYPTVRAGVLHVAALVNGANSPSLVDEYRNEQRAAAASLAGVAVGDIPSIAAWRRVFRGFGVDPTQYRSAPEALLRSIAKRGELPTINCAVDIGNLISVRHALAVAVFDLTKLSGAITVRFAEGTESFTGIGVAEPSHPEPGEVIFVDTDHQVLARRWCWRQSTYAATDSTTATALFVIEGHHDAASDDIEAALADLEALLASHQPRSTWRRREPGPAGLAD